jgi:rod shape determining protein RodA
MSKLSSIPKNKGIDWITLSVYLSLLAIGWVMIFSTLYEESNPYGFLNLTSPMGAQTMWTVLSLFGFISVLVIDWKFWNVLAFPIYGIMLMMLVLVLLFGDVINGARAWFSFGFFSFQPSEWAKFATALAISSYLSFSKTTTTTVQTVAISSSIFLIPALLILLQPDFGSALVYFSFIVLLYRRGLNPIVPLSIVLLAVIFIFSLKFGTYLTLVFLMWGGATILAFDMEKPLRATYISVGVLLVLLFMASQGEEVFIIVPSIAMLGYYGFLQFYKKNFRIFNVMAFALVMCSLFSYGTNFLFDNVVKPHQQERINVWLRPERCDPRGSLYNIIQSKLAIGSGGIAGKGFLHGTMTKLNYVPEQSTDFIFTSIGEEQGFIGVLGVITLFTILLIRCVIIAERANLEFVRNYAYCIVGIFFVHFFFNIGMTMNLLPVVGIPLPLISKGGSSLMAFSIMIGVLLKMDLARYRAN